MAYSPTSCRSRLQITAHVGNLRGSFVRASIYDEYFGQKIFAIGPKMYTTRYRFGASIHVLLHVTLTVARWRHQLYLVIHKTVIFDRRTAFRPRRHFFQTDNIGECSNSLTTVINVNLLNKYVNK